jgi:F-type H+-transporting ATPase subunit b
MPQLDFANPLTVSQVVWMFIIFGALYAALRFWALPQVGGVIETREQRILADLDSARVAKEQADAAAAEIVERSRSASAEAQAQIAQAIAAAKAEAAEKARLDNEHLEQQLAEAEQRIGVARNNAMGALRQVATEAAATVVARLTGQPPDPARIDAAVGEAMAARG